MRYALSLLAAFVFVSCTSSPPEGVHIETEAAVPWAYPDTVSVYVFGTMRGNEIIWGEPDDVQQTWLDKHDYARERLELSKAGTESVQNLKGIEGMDAMAKVYYVHVE